MEFFLCVFGMVMIVEGLPYFGFPSEIKRLLALVLDADDSTLRKVGGFLMAMGLLIIFAARRGMGAP
jgi:uncharacterized protein YjeT (DUF2065 family)